MIVISTNAQQVSRQLNAKGNQMRLLMDRALREVGQQVTRDVKGITHSWDHPVETYIEIDTRGGVYEMLAGTDDQIFNWLDRGVRGRFIKPVRRRALRFWSGFRPKTSPGGMRSGAGGSFGMPVFSKGHWWPGIKPRRWTPKIQKRADRKFRAVVKKAVRQWTKT